MEQNQTQNPGTAGDANGPAAGPRHGWDEIRDVRRLSRPHHDRMVAGVATGLARHLDVDPLLVRIGFAVLAFFGGAGLFLYAALWLVLPDDESGRAPVPLDRRSLQFAVVGIAAVAVVVLLGGTWGGWPFPWQLFLVVGLVLFVMSRRNARTEDQQWQPAPAQAPSPQAYGQPYPQPYPQQYPPASGGQGPPAATVITPAAPVAPRNLDETAPLHGTPLVSAAPVAAAHPYDQQPVTPTVQHQDWQRPANAYPNGATASYGPLASPAPQPPRVKVRRPRDPRKRGPILFWITLALIALGIGILGMADVAGVAVADSAYPALALGITAAMLLLGAFWGRAGGLIALGLVATLATGTTLVGERWETEDIRLTPTTAAQAVGDHEFHTGTFVLDLTQVKDLSAFDGQEIRVDGGAGRVEVIVPEGLNPYISADVGMGNLALLDSQRGDGIGLSRSYGPEDGREGVPEVRIVLNLGVGELLVNRGDEDGRLSLDDSTADSAAAPAAVTLTEGALR